MGTYYDIQTGRNRAEEWKAYISKMGRFVPICGETCKPDPPRPGSRFDCENALQEMEYLHWSALDDIWHPDVIRGWKDKGCFREISKRLGYRLTLLRATFSPKVRAGSELQVKVVLQNTGFASPLLERPVYLLLIGQDSILRQKINVDPRRWLPGEHTFDATLSLPANLPPGDYSLALWLPDPAPTLQNDPRYSIRFANENTWDAAHGWNVLGSVRIETTTVLVSFSVVDRQKRPLEGARLSVSPNLVGPDDIQLRPGGTFTLRIPDVGKYEFTVEWTSPFGTTAKATVTDTPAGLQARGSITLPVDDVTVQVVDINGRPVAKAFIKFGGRDIGWTDGQGVIVVERVPLDQDITVVVIKDGVEVGGYRYRFTASSRSTTIRADIYDITVLVKGSDGQPIQGALVELFKAGKMIARAATDSSGTAVFTKVVGADYEVRVSYEQFSSKASLPKGTHSAQLTLDLYTVLLGIPMTYTILLALIVGLILFTVLIAVIMSQKIKQ